MDSIWKTMENLLALEGHHQRELIIGICIVTSLNLLLIAASYFRGKKLQARVEALQMANHRIASSQEKQFLKKVRNQTQAKLLLGPPKHSQT
jgi:hypothetical protein